MEVKNSLAKKDSQGVERKSFTQALQTEKYQNLINSAIVDEKKRGRFVTAIVSAVSVSPKLQKCTFPSIISAALQGEALELSPSPSLGEYALVPYGSKWNSELQDYESYTAQFQIMTNGKIQLAMRSGLYEDLDAIEIREGEYKGKDKRTGKPVIEFIEDDNLRESKAVIGYYAYFKLLNGFFKAVYLPKAAVINHASTYSKAFDKKLYEKVTSGAKLDWKEEKSAEAPWYKHFDEMAKNLAFRKVLKNAPKSIEMRTAEEYEEKEETGIAEAFVEENNTSEEFFQNQEVENNEAQGSFFNGEEK